MAVVVAAGSVLILSLSDEPPPARSGLVSPNVPDASIDPVETPTGERIEWAPRHRDEIPELPRTNSAEDRKPPPRELREEPWPVLPEQPDADAPPEHTHIDGRNVAATPLAHASKSSGPDGSDRFGFWSPTQTIATGSQTGSSARNGNWSFGGSTPTKLPHKSPPPKPRSACATTETWKERAALDCEESGMILSDIVYLFPCGDGLFRDEEHECAESAPEDDICTKDTMGDGDTCMDPGEFKMWAHEMCKQAGKELVELTMVNDDCGWKAKTATYTCCPLGPEPPPPACQSHAIGDGVTCTDVGSLKQEAFSMCNNLGQTLTDIKPVSDGSCADSEAIKAEVICCIYK